MVCIVGESAAEPYGETENAAENVDREAAKITPGARFGSERSPSTLELERPIP